MNNKLKANTADSDILNLPKVNDKDTKIDNVTVFTSSKLKLKALI